jgi:hypothetical protein
MFIFVRIDGEGKRRITVDAETSVGDIKLEILRLERIKVDHQKVIWRNKELPDEATIRELGLIEDDILNVVLIPRAG